MYDIVLDFIKYLPPVDFIEKVLVKHPLELEINRRFYEIVNGFSKKNQLDILFIEDTYAMIDGSKDHLWEIINTGHYSKVDKCYRQLYTLASLQKATLLLIRGESHAIQINKLFEKCIWELDNGLLLGCAFDHPTYQNCLNDCLNLIQQNNLNEANELNNQKIIEFDNGNESSSLNRQCDIEICQRPSIQQFKSNYFDRAPVILSDCMNQWPSMTKWNQPEYLLNICKNRIVPIEIGKNYTNENWSQELVKFDDFFRRQLIDYQPSTSKRVEYLAQHNLFDQIPALRNDIITPEYCCVSDNECSDEKFDVDIKAWLGPEGTISPMHIDDKHNLLCQVFGSKHIILAAPKDSVHLYPHEGDMLKNTSQIDAEHLDFDRFPLLRNVKFYSFTLHKGEMLYIPSKWWHYVRSLSRSFSVSFWWE